MKNITYINAGAGSGKTYTLTHRLADLVAEGKAHSHQVILTTFTKKAAAEFKEKAKGVLFQKGLCDEAVGLDQALVGTVHSVANTLINKFWFKLGLSPQMGVMAEEDVDFYVSQSVSDLPTDEELRALFQFIREFKFEYPHESGKSGLNADLWKEHLKQIIAFSANYEITDYSLSEQKSLEFIRQIAPSTNDFRKPVKELRKMLEEHQATLDSYKESDANNKRKQGLQKLVKQVNRPTIAWYAELADLLEKTSKKNGASASAMLEDLKGMWNSQIISQQVEGYVRLLFQLATRWQEKFARYKRERQVLDYNDMEKYLLLLMDMPDVCEELQTRFRYLFVDEFQDCSPIQVKIFDRLSDLMEHSYWVGDYKQSIYGFRGSNITMVKAVVDRIAKGKDGCDTQTLDTSYRSLPDIVKVCNAAFTQTFSGILRPENIVLNEHRENKSELTSLQYWNLTDSKSDNSLKQIARQVACLILRKGEKSEEIAVLCRKNKDLQFIAQTLTEEYNIPVNRSCISIQESRATELLKALLRLVIDDGNLLARSAIAYLTVKGFNVETLIDDKLQYDANETNISYEYLNDIPLVATLRSKRKQLRQKSLADIVETVVIELDLFNVVKQWKDAAVHTSCLNALIGAASTYEQRCMQLGMPATINGYLHYIESTDIKATGNPKGVQLYTYHGSKGLQWKRVILQALNNHPADEQTCLKHNVFGIHFCYEVQPSEENPYPEVHIRVMPYLYGKKHVPAGVKDRLETEAARLASIAEENRLLYVGMTRAADVLTLVVEKEKKGLQWLHDVGLRPDESALGNREADLLNADIPFIHTTCPEEVIDTLEPYQPEDAAYLNKRIVQDSPAMTAYPPRDIAPSSLKGRSEVTTHTVIGERIPIRSKAELDYAQVGNCVHQIYNGIAHTSQPEAFARQMIAAYGLTDVLVAPEDICRAWSNLVEWLTAHHGPATKVFHERPFMHYKDGQILTGSMDLVWQTAEGTILIDFKTNPQGKDIVLHPESEHYAGLYAGQMKAYTDALQQAGERVVARYIYYPISGLLVGF